MKRIKILGFAFAMLGITTLSQAQNEMRKEVNVEVINGEHLLTITTTDKDGKVTTEEYKGDAAKEKMHELERNVPKGAVIEKEIIEETTDVDGNEVIIRKSHAGKKRDMHWMHHPGPPMSEEERAEFHQKMKEAMADLDEEERRMFHHQMRMHKHNLTPEERKEFHEKMMAEDIDVSVDEENGEITIKMGDEIEVIKIADMKEMGDGHHRMMFISEDEDKDGKKIKREIVVITKNVTIEDADDLQNDLKGIKFNTYPNPNNGDFFIEVKLDGKTPTFFKVSDLTGKVIHNGEIKFKEKGIHTLPVKMEEFNPGTYLIQIVQGDKAATKKVIIE